VSCAWNDPGSGACWLADSLWRQLELDLFFAERLGCSREQTEWEKVLRTMTIYRLISPGSEWRMHRHWFSTTALPDLLNVDERVAQPSTLYRCHDLLLEHKEALFAHLRERWINLFAAQYDILLYDLTSTYFECDAPEDENDPRKFGYSRDRRSDCVQVVIAMVVTPEGLPLAYEMMPGNTSDKKTLLGMIALLKERHGQIGRIWVMDRGIPTEASLAQMRACEPAMHYLVGTPKARLNRLEAALAERPWVEVRAELRVKCVPEDGEMYVLTESPARVDKERSMRRRLLKKYWKRLGELSRLKKPARDQLLIKLGQAKGAAGASAKLVIVEVSAAGVLTYRLDKYKLREVRRRESRPDDARRHRLRLRARLSRFPDARGELARRVSQSGQTPSAFVAAPVFHRYLADLKVFELFFAAVTMLVSSPSFVSNNKPSLLKSSRPTGYSRPRTAGTSSVTRGRPSGSAMLLR